MFLSQKNVLLIVVDFQEKLVKHIEEIDSVIKNSLKLIRAFKVLDLPILLTEQVKLGDTVSEIKDAAGISPIKKHTFSCLGSEKFYREFRKINAKACVLIGIEAHICILQTALDLIKEGCSVYVSVDCVGSRNKIDKEVAIQRMMLEGVKPVTAEMVIYEIVRSAEHTGFKEILKIIKG